MRKLFGDTTVVFPAFLALLLAVLILVFRVAPVGSQDRQLRPAPETGEIIRTLDSTVGAVCYLYKPTGSLSCIKLLR